MKRKTICVIGSTTEKGKSLCLKYARLGYDIGVCYTKDQEMAEKLEELILGMGSRVELFQYNGDEKSDFEKVIYRFVDFYGHIDFVVNCLEQHYSTDIEEILFQMFPEEKAYIKKELDKEIPGAEFFKCRPEMTQNPKIALSVEKELKSKAGIYGKTIFNVRDYGAVGDNFTDDTRAIQDAIDRAAECDGTVYFPAGIYCVGRLVLHPNICLKADPVWSYRTFNGAVLRLNDYNASCLLDVTDAHGVHIYGLCLDGKNKGDNIHGIAILRDTPSKQEDMIQIEKCRIGCFSGDGVHFDMVWAYWIKHSQIIFNSGHGIYNSGTGAFLLDNFITANVGKGYYSNEKRLNITTTAIGNRIEWNRGGGMYLNNALTGMLSNNIFDRSGGTSLYLGGAKGAVSVNINSNVFFRNSNPNYGYDKDECNSHIYLEHAKGVTLVGNSFMAGRDDIAGELSPKYGVVLDEVSNVTMSGNSLYCGSVQENIHFVSDKNREEHNIVIENNCETQAPDDLKWW